MLSLLMKIFALTLFLSFSFSAIAQETLTEFRTDYCTNYKEGTRQEPELWKHCCLLHDLFFWAGGTKSDRYSADLDLRTCVEETGAYQQAKLIYYAVRLGSYSPVKFPDKKWNNGWKKRSDFQALTPEDIDQVESEILSGYDFISFDIKDKFLFKLRSRRESK